MRPNRQARRHQELTAEIARLDAALAELLTHAAPGQLLAKQGVAAQVAATLLATAGDNPGRVRREASFAALCGASPVDASSGKQIRHRLNRGGDRQANAALWTIAMTRLAHDPRTKATARPATFHLVPRHIDVAEELRAGACLLFPFLLSQLF
jgi:transposase